MYEYAARVTRILDGDTVEAVIDLGFRLSFKTRIRLAGLQAPERNTVEGQTSTAALTALLDQAERQVIVRTRLNREFEKYGRVLGTLYAKDQATSINTQLITQGAAVPA